MLQVMERIDPMSSAHERVLSELVDGATEIFHEIDHASVCVTHRDARVETTAASSELPSQLDKLQDAPSRYHL